MVILSILTGDDDEDGDGCCIAKLLWVLINGDVFECCVLTSSCTLLILRVVSIMGEGMGGISWLLER